jgi:hypothetical protein
MPGPDAGDTVCEVPTGAGTTHSGDIMGNERWTAADSPHLITSNVRIFATVTLEPCAVVRLGERNGIQVGSTTQTGKLVAQGTPTQQVTFAAVDSSKPWGSISVNVLGSLDFTDTVLVGGANPASAQNGGGVVVAYGTASNQPMLTRSLRFVNVTISNAAGHAVNLQRMSGFTADSKNLRVTESGGMASPWPIVVEAGAVGPLPTVSFLAHRSPDILVEPRGSMPDDTFKNLGAPYRIGGRLLVAPSVEGSTSTLTVEGGVTLKMDTTSDSGLTVGTSDTRRGVLIANGTVAAPILFTSAKDMPAAGDWKNIYFRNTPSSGNAMTYVTVEYAGGVSGLQGYGCGPADNDGSVLIVPDSGRPTSAFIQNSTIRNGGGDTGLLLGWRSDMSGPDFINTNTFERLPACQVSRWSNDTGAECPGSTNGSPVCLL